MMDISMLRSFFFNARARALRPVFSWIAALVLLTGLLSLGASPASAASRTQKGGLNTRALPASALSCPASLGFGDIVLCTLSSAGEVDSFTFSGNANDVVYVRMSKSTGTIWPYVNINNPGGTHLCGAVNASDHTTVGLTCTLPTTGTYTLLASDYTGTATGDYYLYLQRLNNPGNATSIAFGQTLSGTIGTPAQNDTYTFAGNANDMVYVRMSKSTGSIWPYVNIYNPDGTSLCGGYNAFHGTVGVTCALPATGTYTILASDNPGTATGNYFLYLQRLNDPGKATSIAFGQTLSGTIGTPAQNDTYTFAGIAGDKVFVRLASSSISLSLFVYNLDGTSLCGGINASENQFLDFNCSLPATGSYAILVSDSVGTGIGGYSLFLQRLNAPGNSMPIAYGDLQTGTINTPAQMDTYTFTAVAGVKVLLQMAEATQTYFGPEVWLFDPDGMQVGTPGCVSSTYFLDGCTLDTAGTYTILASEYDGISTVGYYLSLQRANDPVNAAPITFGVAHSGSITMPTQMDPYTFTANAGDNVLVRTSVLSGTIRPEIRLYGSDGTMMCYTSGGPVVTLINCTLPITGTYSILVDDYYGNSLGDYFLFIQRLNNPGNATSIALGQILSGSILLPGEMDTFSYTTTAADDVLLRMTKTSLSDTLWPEIAIYGTDGSLLCENSGYSSAEIASCNLPGPGIYTILLDDYYQMYTGSYDLYLQSLINPGAGMHIYLPLVLRSP